MFVDSGSSRLLSQPTKNPASRGYFRKYQRRIFSFSEGDETILIRGLKLLKPILL